MNHDQMRTTFDHDRFRGDVLAFIERQQMTKIAVAEGVGLSTSSLAYYLHGRDGRPYGCSVHTAAALAVLCDLSLDQYVRVAQPA